MYDVNWAGVGAVAFIRLRKFPSIPVLLGVFIMKGCWISASAWCVCDYGDDHV